MPRGNRHALVIGPVPVIVDDPAVDQAEERHEVGPGAIALIHRVGMARLVLDQPGEQAGDRVILDEQVVGRKHLPLLGVEQEDQPHQDGEQPFVDLVRSVGPVA